MTNIDFKKINWESTLFVNGMWAMFFLLGAFALVLFLRYITTIEEPMRFMGTIFALWFMIHWYKWVGFPEILYHKR